MKGRKDGIWTAKGIGGGAIIGAILGGPAGAVVGGAIGAYIGNALEDKLE